MYQQTNHQVDFFSRDDQAIVALCTPRGSGAIGLIRVSGINAVSVVDAISRLSSHTNLHQQSSHTIHHGHIIDPTTNSSVDEVLFLLMKAPRTFTGQDTVEITCHNNPFIVEKIINLVVAHGGRAAGPGEFSRRAFLSGKIDLIQAEAIHDVITSQTEQALKHSLATVQGSLSQFFRVIEQDLVNLLSYVEASFEFLDEEQRDFDFDVSIKNRIDHILQKISDINTNASQQKLIKEGIRIALLGSVNAGKSTLFNALLNQNRAIVADIAGTTRDMIEAGAFVDGNFWLFVDTAGMRTTDDVIEKIGIEKSLEQAICADVILLVIDNAVEPSDDDIFLYKKLVTLYGQKIIFIFNKVEPGLDDWSEKIKTLISLEYENIVSVKISAREKIGIAQLRLTISHKINSLFDAINSPFLLNQRQHNLLIEIDKGLKNIANSYFNPVSYELIACHLKDILEKISELTGKDISEKVLDTIFGEFCIGK